MSHIKEILDRFKMTEPLSLEGNIALYDLTISDIKQLVYYAYDKDYSKFKENIESYLMNQPIGKEGE